MIGDTISIEEQYYIPLEPVVSAIQSRIASSAHPICVSFGGESGSGKTTQSKVFKELLEREGINTVLIHLDDYFLLPPKSNHERRKADINNVGPKEVNLEQLNNDILAIKAQESDILTKPLVNYDLNVIRREFLEIEDVQVVIIEGTYSSLLEAVDIRFFMMRNYQQTKMQRLARGRDTMSDFNERVLMIEHEIIRKHSRIADYIIDVDYNVTKSIPTSELGPHLWI